MTTHIQGLLFDEPAAEAPKPRAREPFNWLTSMLRTHPGWTIGELDRHHAYIPGSYARWEYVEKLARLEADGFVRRGERRVCGVDGVESDTWFLV